MMKKNKIMFILVILIFSVFLGSVVFAATKDYVYGDSFNFSSGSSSEVGGFVVSSTGGLVANGTSLTYAAFDPTGLSRLNLSGIIDINVSLIANGSHGNYVNITFGWMLAQSNGSTMLNTTVFNHSAGAGAGKFNQTSFNYSFNSNLLIDGVYNISVYVQNVSNDFVVNFSRGFSIAIDRTPPNVTQFTMSNLTNNSNVTGGVIFFNVTINDSVTFAKSASIGLMNNFNNGTTGAGFNVTLIKNFSGIFHTALVLSNMTDGFYTVQVYANDSLDNVNMSVANLTFTLDRTPPNVTQFTMSNLTNNSNVTGGVIFFNVTINDSVTFAKFASIGLTNNFNNGTQFNITLVRNSSVFHTAVLLSAMTDGFYTVQVYANDSLDNVNMSVANLSFTLDRTGPNVTNIFLGNWTNGANISNGIIAGGTAVLNITVEANDSLTPNPGNPDTNLLAQVYFNITNSTGQINFTRAVANLSLWNASVSLNLSDTRYFPDGVYSILVYSNDSLNNLNRTQNLTFTLDRTLPTVSVSCTSSPTVGSTVTCTCTASDGTSGLSGSATFLGDSDGSESTTAGSVGSYTSSICSATDYAGNRQTATGSWTVVAASSSGGGGGGGGSGGGVSKGVENQFEKKTWTSINKGETATVSVKDGQIGVTGVEFKTAATTYGVTVQVEKVTTLPTTVKALDTKVYKYVKITESNVAKALDGVAKVNFKVTKEWLKEQGLGKDNVVLYRSVDNAWVALKTTVGEDDGTYQHYVAETPGFSYFAIGQGVTAPAVLVASAAGDKAVQQSKGQESSASTDVATLTPTAETVPGSVAESAQTDSSTDGGAGWVWVVFVLAIAAVVAIVYWWVKK